MSMTLVQVVVSGLLLGAVYALFASGLTLIWGMMNVVNFAHGDFVMLGMYTAVIVWTALGGGPWASVPLAAIAIATLGIVSYFLLVRHIMRGPMLAQILGTFGLALFLRYGAFNVFGANFRTLPDTLVGGSFVLGDIRFEGSRVLAGAVGSAVASAVALALTAIGNTAANRRLTFGIRGRDGLARQHAAGFLMFVIALGLTNGALSNKDESKDLVIEGKRMTAKISGSQDNSFSRANGMLTRHRVGDWIVPREGGTGRDREHGQDFGPCHHKRMPDGLSS